MKKYICALLCCILFSSCSVQSKEILNNHVTTLSSEFISTEHLNIDKENFIKINHLQSNDLDFKQYKMYDVDNLKNRKIVACQMLRDELILESYSKVSRNELEIGILNLKSNEYRKIGNSLFSAAYGSHSMVMKNRFYITTFSYEDEDNLFGKTLLYDALNDEMTEVDNFKILNIVQCITPVKDNGFAYCYYEHYTQDWVIKYYDLVSNACKEIFRYSNYTESNISPMAISFIDNDIALVMQYSEENKYFTQIAYINIENGLYNVESIDLNKYFGAEYEIYDFIIQDQFYFLKVGISGSVEWHIFRRKNDKLEIVLPAIFHLNELAVNKSISSSNSLFRQYNSKNADLIELDIFNASINTYNIKGIDSKEIEYITSNGKEIIFILNSDNIFQYGHSVDYNDFSNQSFDKMLFEYPQDEYDSIIPEKAKEMQLNIENRLKLLCENDFRWKFLFDEKR